MKRISKKVFYTTLIFLCQMTRCMEQNVTVPPCDNSSEVWRIPLFAFQMPECPKINNFLSLPTHCLFRLSQFDAASIEAHLERSLLPEELEKKVKQVIRLVKHIDSNEHPESADIIKDIKLLFCTLMCLREDLANEFLDDLDDFFKTCNIKVNFLLTKKTYILCCSSNLGDVYKLIKLFLTILLISPEKSSMEESVSPQIKRAKNSRETENEAGAEESKLKSLCLHPYIIECLNRAAKYKCSKMLRLINKVEIYPREFFLQLMVLVLLRCKLGAVTALVKALNISEEDLELLFNSPREKNVLESLILNKNVETLKYILNYMKLVGFKSFDSVLNQGRGKLLRVAITDGVYEIVELLINYGIIIYYPGCTDRLNGDALAYAQGRLDFERLMGFSQKEGSVAARIVEIIALLQKKMQEYKQ